MVLSCMFFSIVMHFEAIIAVKNHTFDFPINTIMEHT